MAVSTAELRKNPERYVQNVMRVIADATIDQWKRGIAWYDNAHQLAVMLADGGDARQMAGVIAALSANKSWKTNVRLATDAVNGSVHGNVGDALRKASDILHGADPEEVLPMDAKTGCFFRAIANPRDTRVVVVDRHAHDIAVGEVYGERNRGLFRATRYDTIADIYREVAFRLGIQPMQVQAIAWIVWTER